MNQSHPKVTVSKQSSRGIETQSIAVILLVLTAFVPFSAEALSLNWCGAYLNHLWDRVKRPDRILQVDGQEIPVFKIRLGEGMEFEAMAE